MRGRAMSFPKIHDLYLARTVLTTVMLTWAVLLGLDMMLSMVSEFGNVGEGGYGVVQALTYVLYTVPRHAYTLFPTAAVIGALMALGQLAATSELTALRAIGLSRRRMTLAVMIALALLTVLMVINGETLAPLGQRNADILKASSRSNNLIVARYSGVWAREGAIILNAEGGEERSDGDDRWLELNDVRLYEFEDDGRLQSLAVAKIAEHRPGGWLLREVTRTTFDADSVTRTQVAEERWDSQLDATALSADIDRPRYLTARELHESVAYRQRNGLDASDYEEHYWGRWFYPLNVLALCLAAIPFAFGSLRSGGLGKRLFIGIVFALGFWLLQTQFVKMASAFKFDFRVAYALPTVIMVGVSMLLFRKRSG
ncbi:LPS export ABC transporter permease LptG [Lysobacter avium]|uniref:LPS export ABC transporter permease LptG n=2 Tax=Novilysobacter avium TaxID=2781023 RepID=A0A7S6ULB3_9GAMM|nr:MULTISPECIES: LPS export ABC transporter permease LptG [Lysobacter]QOW22437.1 LPS export ABC transporter permease LptG [Lysobacter avium]QOW24950.1 LPS export ABC transporter permease LptG [Lysobacter sp. H23M47]